MIPSQIELALVTPNLEGELEFRSDSSKDKETCNLPLIALCMHEMSASRDDGVVKVGEAHQTGLPMKKLFLHSCYKTSDLGLSLVFEDVCNANGPQLSRAL